MITSISVIIWAATTSTSVMMMILMLFCKIMGCYFFANMRAWTYWSIGFVCYDYHTFDVNGSLVNLLRLIVNPGLESIKNSCSHSNMQGCLRSFCFCCAPNKTILWMGCLLLKLECKPCTHEWYQWKKVIKVDEAFPIPTSMKWLLFFRVLEQAMILQCLVIKITLDHCKSWRKFTLPLLVEWLMFKVTVAYNQSRSDSLVLPGAKIVAS